MQRKFLEPNTPQKVLRPSADSDILRPVREIRINPLQALEQRLVEPTWEEQRRKWPLENREEIEDYNRRVEMQGVFSNGLRRF